MLKLKAYNVFNAFYNLGFKNLDLKPIAQTINVLIALVFCSIATNILSKENRIAAEER
jgi:hypothetical protein